MGPDPMALIPEIQTGHMGVLGPGFKQETEVPEDQWDW